MPMANMNRRCAGLVNECRPFERALASAEDQATFAAQGCKVDQVARVREALCGHELREFNRQVFEILKTNRDYRLVRGDDLVAVHDGMKPVFVWRKVEP